MSQICLRQGDSSPRHTPLSRGLHLTLMTLLAAGSASAQLLPQGSQMLRELEREQAVPEQPRQGKPALSVEEQSATPPPAAPNAPVIFVSQVQVHGNHSIDSPSLQTLLQDISGRNVTLAELHLAAARLSQYYHFQGFPVAYAYVPPQSVAGGVVVIEVLEGRYDEVKHSQPPHLGGAALAPLERIQPGQVVRTEELEHVLLLLNDLPGVQAQAQLAPGRNTGDSSLLLDARLGTRISGAIDLDNHGNRYTGSTRLGARIQLASPLGLGDSLSIRGLHSDEKQRLLQLAYQVPVSRWGTQVGVGHTSMDYELGRNFSVLEAHGSAHTNSLFLWQPLVVKRGLRLNTRLQYEHKRFQDDMDLVQLYRGKKSELLSLSLEGNSQDRVLGGGSNVFSLKWSHGDLKLRSPVDQQIDAITARSQGSFNTLQATLARWQYWSPRWSSYVQLQAQWADGNLDPSEKMSLGGAYGVRAYPQGEASGDQGWQGTAELRYALSTQWTLQTFVDYGKVRLTKKPWQPGSNHQSLSGAGVGTTWTGDRWRLGASLAWRLGGDAPSSDSDRKPRAWVSGTWLF
ncbi:ShlB/FhaC/HecB family hemolysin secretion/activation protein [Comamonas composti]|uniref:ShlB/FhaC/HecB family hemolysin secretion/activation protein n=1 Tax=Comamonas composti TaxID=408558 RepID=UPI000A0490AD|nr:ShlB/FhaC/HecB family hemolysin secretion/activation protein [Comamonas composti]